MNQSAEDRVAELELVLENLLECFDVGVNGIEATDVDENLFFLDEGTVEAIERATDTLARGRE